MATKLATYGAAGDTYGGAGDVYGATASPPPPPSGGGGARIGGNKAVRRSPTTGRIARNRTAVRAR